MAAAQEWHAELERVVREGKEDFDFMFKSLGDSGAVDLVEALRGNTTVRRLSISNNAIGDVGAAAIAELLREEYGGGAGENGSPLVAVHLNSNCIGRPGIEALAEALRFNTSLERLWLMSNPGAQTDGGGSEAEAAIESLVSVIGVNTALEKVRVHPSLRPVPEAAGRRAGRLRGTTSRTRAVPYWVVDEGVYHKKG
jgi:Leucine Rich repeat